jgi:hypothetical protein
MRLYSILAMASAVLISLSLAQSSPNRFTVVVQDVAEGPIAEASVHVQHWTRLAPGKSRLIQDGIATTDAQGRSSFELGPGQYEVFASAPGFAPAVASPVFVRQGEETRYIFKLHVGEYSGPEVESPPK